MEISAFFFLSKAQITKGFKKLNVRFLHGHLPTNHNTQPITADLIKTVPHPVRPLLPEEFLSPLSPPSEFVREDELNA